jgi:hypothetical protein
MEIPSIRVLGPADSRPSTSFDMVNDASAASVKPSHSLIEGKFSRPSDAEFPVAVSVDEVWRHLKTIGGHCQ